MDDIKIRVIDSDKLIKAINDGSYEVNLSAVMALGSVVTSPTLYGYDIKVLAFVASIMAKEGVSPEEAVHIFRDINRVVEIMLEDQRDSVRKTFEQMFPGGQDE